MQLVVAPVRKLPVASVITLVDAGEVCVERGREGLASLTAQLLLEGTIASDGAELVERFERLGTSAEAASDWDAAWMTLTALREQLGPAIKLLGEVLRQPSFPQREVERLKAERLADLLKLRAEPRGLADEMFTRVLYENSSRYARPEGGSEVSVEAITREDVLAFYENRYRPGGVTLIVTGDISGDEAERLAEETFGDWQGSAPKHCSTTDAPARATRALHVVSKPEAQQAELRIGNVGLPRSHPDYYSAVVMNAVLGGLFSSRINLNLREKHGYTYGAFSHIDWRRQAGPFVVSTAVQTEVAAPAATEAISEIARLRESKVDKDELSLATSYLDGVFPIRYETTDAIAGALATLVQYSLPDDFYDTYREHVRSVTADDVLRVARSHLNPDALQLLAVGDTDSLLAPLEAIGFGKATLYDTDGGLLDEDL